MAIHLINYADWRFSLKHKEQQTQQITTANRIGIDNKNIHGWNRERLIKTSFYKNHKDILDEKLGAGLWLYNPFLINKYLNELTSKDILIYADCDIPFIRPLDLLIQVCESNNGLFYMKNKHYNIRYTKKYCFRTMNCDVPKYHWTTQITAGFVIVKRNPFTLKFFKEFLALCCNKKLIDDNTYGVSNYKEFIAHRHPVSVLTNLHRKYNLNAFCAPVDPDLFFEKYKAKDYGYEDIFNNDEKRHNATYLGVQLLGGQIGSMNNKRRFATLKSKAKRMKQEGIKWKKDHKKGFILTKKS